MSTRKSEQQQIAIAFLTCLSLFLVFSFYQCQAKIVQKYHSPDNQPQYCVSFWNYP